VHKGPSRYPTCTFSHSSWFARVRSVVNAQKETGSLSSRRKTGSGEKRDWKSIQEKLVEKGYHRAPELLNSEKIRIVLDIFCEQSAKG
jgi:hypothetical protein